MCALWRIWALHPIRDGAAISALALFSRRFPSSAAALCSLGFTCTHFGTSLHGPALARCSLRQSRFHSSKRHSFAESFWAFYSAQVESTCRSLLSPRSLQQSIF